MHGCTPPVSLQHLMGVHSHLWEVKLQVASGCWPLIVHGLQVSGVPVQLSGICPHSQPAGRSAGQLFGVQQEPELQT